MKYLLPLLLLSIPASVFAHSALHSEPLAAGQLPVLASLSLLEKIGAPIIEKNKEIDVAYARLSPEWREKVSAEIHRTGGCGGYELLPEMEASSSVLQKLAGRVKKDRAVVAASGVTKRPEIEAALPNLKEENIRATVEWLSAYPSRYNRQSNPNAHVNDMEERLRAMLASYPHPFTVQQISHTSTPQKSLRVHLEGKSRASEIVVLGGHLDSVSSRARAPGADDNASGSASLLEALRVLVTQGRPERSVEFFWYAGEESGLLGSGEIARQYKAEGKDVVAVLQLDMTLFPGSGELVIANVNDFTSAWLRSYLVAANDAYIQARLVDDSCGYACSDHASWYRQGYPTLMPFEALTERMNNKIHTDQDVISASSSFRHSLAFSKIALLMAMDLGNSTQRQP